MGFLSLMNENKQLREELAHTRFVLACVLEEVGGEVIVTETTARRVNRNPTISWTLEGNPVESHVIWKLVNE